jgi:hypothetical protein
MLNQNSPPGGGSVMSARTACTFRPGSFDARILSMSARHPPLSPRSPARPEVWRRARCQTRQRLTPLQPAPARSPRVPARCSTRRSDRPRRGCRHRGARARPGSPRRARERRALLDRCPRRGGSYPAAKLGHDHSTDFRAGTPDEYIASWAAGLTGLVAFFRRLACRGGPATLPAPLA